MILRVNSHKMWSGQFTGLGASRAEFLDQFSIRLKDKNTGGPIIYHHQMTGPVNSYAFRACKVKGCVSIKVIVALNNFPERVVAKKKKGEWNGSG